MRIKMTTAIIAGILLMLSAACASLAATSVDSAQLQELQGGCGNHYCVSPCGTPCSDWGEECTSPEDCVRPCSRMGAIQVSCIDDGYIHSQVCREFCGIDYCGYAFDGPHYCLWDEERQKKVCLHSGFNPDEPCRGCWAEGADCIGVIICWIANGGFGI